MDPSSLKVNELRNELSARGLSTKGVKKELVARLEEALANEAKDPDASSPTENKDQHADSPMEQDPPATDANKDNKAVVDQQAKDSQEIAQVAPPTEETRDAPAAEAIVTAPAPVPAAAPNNTLSALAPVVGTPSLHQEGLIDTTATAASVTTEKPSASAPMEQVQVEALGAGGGGGGGKKRSKAEAEELDQEARSQGQEEQEDARTIKKARQDETTTTAAEGDRRSDAPSPSPLQTAVQASSSSSPALQSSSSGGGQEGSGAARASSEEDRRGTRQIDARSLMERQVQQAAKDRGSNQDAGSAKENQVKDQETLPQPANADRALAIVNFVRPLTLPQVKRMLSEFGEIEHFWMDSIKTHCYVTFKTVEMAQKAYQGTKDVVFPKETGKALEPHFISAEDARWSSEEAEKAQNNKQKPVIYLGPTPGGASGAGSKPRTRDDETLPATATAPTAAATTTAVAATTSPTKDDAAQRREERKARQPQPQIVQPNELFQRTTTLPVLYFKALVDPPTKPASALQG